MKRIARMAEPTAAVAARSMLARQWSPELERELAHIIYRGVEPITIERDR